MNVLRRWLLAACLGVGVAIAADATMVVPPNFDELVNQSDFIVRAVVKSIKTEERTTPNGKPVIYSLVELDVKKVIAGKPPTPLVLEVLGGKSGGREMRVEGVPRFAVGQESIFFVQGNGRQIFPLVRMMHGLYPVKRDTGSGREYVTRSNGAPLNDVQEVSRPLNEGSSLAVSSHAQSSGAGLSPDDFVKKIESSTTNHRLLEK